MRRDFGDFAFGFCDPQLDGFCTTWTTILASDLAFYFVNCPKCEIVFAIAFIPSDRNAW